MANDAGIFTISQEEKQKSVVRLVERSALSGEFMIMLVLSSIIVTIGFLLNNIPIIIGGMLVTPLLFPPLGLALSIVTNNNSGIWRGSKNIASSVAIVIAASLLISLVFFKQKSALNDSEILLLIEPNLLYLFVSIAAGIAAAFAIAKPQLSEALPGVAIAVTLLPPLSMISIGMARLSPELIAASFQLFFVNIVGIIFGSIIIFSLMGFYQARRVEVREITQEMKEKEKGKGKGGAA